MDTTAQRLAARADQLYEYDREPVAEAELKSGRYFAGLFAGEHVAATEFVIGAFFVLHGITLFDTADAIEHIGRHHDHAIDTFVCTRFDQLARFVNDALQAQVAEFEKLSA